MFHFDEILNAENTDSYKETITNVSPFKNLKQQPTKPEQEIQVFV